MDNSRAPQSPGGNKRRRSTPSGDVQHTMGAQSQHSTTLPSIRQLPLHSYLTSSPSLPHLSSESSYSYANPPYHSSGLESGSSHLLGTASQREGAGVYGLGDSEGDGDVEQRGPPKKKRRRQALSCTGNYIPSFVIRVDTDSIALPYRFHSLIFNCWYSNLGTYPPGHLPFCPCDLYHAGCGDDEL